MQNEPWKEVAAFLAMSFGVAWLLWLAAYSALVPDPQLLITLGTIAPSAAGLLFTAKLGGKQAVKALLHASVRFRAPWMWWLYAALLFPAVLALTCVVLAAAGGIIPPARFPLWFLPIAFFYIFACMGPLGEELGWRGFLFERFLRQWGLTKAGLLLGLIWSAWHLPLFLIPGTIQYELAGMGLFIALPGYFLYTVCICLLMGVLYARTQGNLLLCLVFHTSCNLSLGVAPVILLKSGAAVLLAILIFATIFILKAAVKKPKTARP